MQTASPETCLECARESIETPRADACAVCSQHTERWGGACGNPLCWDPDRQFLRVHAIGMDVPPLYGKLRRFKYPPAGQETYGWAWIFGRLLWASIMELRYWNEIDVVVAAPSLPRAGRQDRHTERVVAAAAEHDPFFFTWGTADAPIIVQTAQTEAVAGQGIAARRRKAAQLRYALEVVDPAAVDGKHVLVYDDMLTSGHSLNEVARALRQAGALDVSGIVLARAPW